MKKAIPVCAMVVPVLSFASLMPAQGDPFLGTWKLNVKKPFSNVAVYDKQ